MGLLGAVGLTDSLIFAYNAVIHKEIEVECRDGSCVRLSKTPYARVFFNIPNWAFGIAYYLLVLGTAIFAQPWMAGLALLGAFISTTLSLYLIWSLAVKLRAMCRLCYLAHAVNIGLMIVWIVILGRGV
jgi:uncharacterized membrane protein